MNTQDTDAAVEALSQFWAAMRAMQPGGVSVVPEPPYPPIPPAFWDSPAEYVETEESMVASRAAFHAWLGQVEGWLAARREARASAAVGVTLG